MAERDHWSRRRLLSVGAASAAALAGCLGGDGEDDPADPESVEPDGAFAVETVAEGLAHPWGLAFLPDGGLLVTERPGRLRLVERDGTTTELAGVPEVYVAGQGGLLDVTTHPAFPDEPWVYLTYSAANDAGKSTTKLGRGRLDREAARLRGVEELFVAEPFVDSNGHFGSRVVFGPDGLAYVSVGDRQFKDFGPDHVAQDRTNHLGCTVRLDADGTVPADNPFVEDPAARDELFTYGNRNPQGLTVHPATGAIWESEHGERDGDEINVLQAGGNYGWPVADDGCQYGTDEPVGDDPEDRPDTIAPAYVWECGSGGYPPGGTAFYDGDAFPDWQGNLFVGNLAGQYLGRFTVDGRDVRQAESLLTDANWRIRDVATHPDTGELYVAVDAENAPVVRLVPA